MHTLAVGLLPSETAVVEHNPTGGDVVPKTEATQGQPILTTLARPDILEFLDIVLPAEIEGITLEDSQGWSVEVRKLRVLVIQAPKQPIELWNGPNGEARPHAPLRRAALPRFRCWSSRRSSSAGLPLPARYSWWPFLMMARILGSWSSK